MDDAAYLHLHGGVPKESATELCQDIVLDHERNWLEKKLGDEIYLDGLMQALSLFTFAGGVEDKNACEALMKNVPELSDCDQAQFNKLYKTLSSSYPCRQGVDALRPDLLGEFLCGEVLSDELMLAFVTWVLAMIEAHRNDRKDHIEWLLPLAQAEQLSDRAGQWPSGTSANSLPMQWQGILEALPVEVIGQLASTDDTGHLKLRDLNEKLSALHVAGAGDDLSRRAHALNNQGVDLAAVGKREEALAAAQEAVAIRRELAKPRPDAFMPDLAGSLNNVANRLSELGKPDEALAAAQEAVRLYGELAEQRPDAFRPNLATSLNNVANRFSELGKREEALAAAQEAVAIRRELAEQRPDAFRPNLATSLNNVANRFSELGKREEALAARKRRWRYGES